MSESQTKLTGGCLCGSVRYELSAEPIVAGFCHCLSCQKISGAGRVLQVLVPRSALSIQGDVRGYSWRADSGNMVTSQFCPTCGSQLFAENSGMADAKALRAVSLDDPSAITPQMTVYAKRAHQWDHVDADLPSFPEMPPRRPV
jgi:hypothetical protein